MLRAVLASHAWWHISEGTFGLIVVAAIGALVTVQGRRGKRVEAKVDQAVANQDTANGKALGETVHDIAQTQEILSAQIHTNTREVMKVAEAQVQLGEAMERHLEEVTPLIALFKAEHEEEE